VQEEPRNMGAWDYARPRLREILDNRWSLTYIGRPPSSSPAEGSFAWYQYNQESLIRHAYINVDESQKDGVLMEKG
jgi:2-oxoglutarate dehydrogenase E1 component